ncbi:putative Na+/Alanine symporter,thiazide-sensitive Na+/Cl- transporter [Mesoplasma florum L1]|uniref:Na+/Alanine symporter,thiazide-sensitive Na+/Cl-transporter n=1 Tax=Mesoplasma florum (strain ATCC 33453 / NBRC 100688 / NCTC 11704 / L1) TaxID=265311 RepID=Q6F0Q8_MESFL|nr:putative Na+/Alanine symporter,thiazide-sensitive Na+/Cl- transporter [Mesoplasma florum L1]ATI74210.1 hypothetical protein CQZ70_03115 [Mesoplasma florum]AVN61220.1 hypothetical protein CG005_02955 [Mesoplasma florum]
MRYSTIEILQITSAILISFVSFIVSIYFLFLMIKKKQISYKIFYILFLLIISISLFTYTLITMNTLYNSWGILNLITILLEFISVILTVYLFFIKDKNLLKNNLK